MTISSTYIRACVAAGDMASAARALGRPHRVDGVVVRGDRRGREHGLPDGERREPAVHRHPGRRRLRRAPGARATPAAGRAASGSPAAISVGSNPTFQGSRRTVEAFVLDFDGDLYGEHVGVEFAAAAAADGRLPGRRRRCSAAMATTDVSRHRGCTESCRDGTLAGRQAPTAA